MKYRKKPVVIEAHIFKGSTSHITALSAWMAGEEYVEPVIVTRDWRDMIIPTLEGEMTASPGDYIIKGVQGEFYPCKPDIFEQTYEPVED